MSPNITPNQIQTNPAVDLLQFYEQEELEEQNNTIVDQHMSKFCDYTTIEDLATSIKTNTKMSMLNLNIQSLRAHWSDFQLFLDQFSKEKSHFNIIALTELFTIPSGINYEMEGYHPLIAKSRPTQNGIRGGVGMFIDESYLVSQRDDLGVFIPHVIESAFVEIQRSKKEKSVIVGTIYRPNSPPLADLTKCIKIIQDIIEKISNEDKICYLMGDMNILIS